MRVVIITGEYPPVAGGVADYSARLAEALVVAGHDVSVITAGSRSDDAGRAAPAAIFFVKANGWGPRDLRAVVHEASRLRPDIVLFQYVPHMYGRAGINLSIATLPGLLRSTMRARIVTILHELFRDWSLGPGAIPALTHRFQLIMITRGSHGLVVTNPRSRERLLRGRNHFVPVKIIPVGPTIPVIPTTEGERIRLRSALGVGRAPLIGDVGITNVTKRPQDLLVALGRLDPSVRLLCLGGLPSQAPRWQRFLSTAQAQGLGDRVLWTGYLPANDLSRHLTTLDLLAHTAEGGASTRSTVLASALMHGLPVVAYRGPETADMFIHEENVLLASRADVKAFVNQVKGALESPQTRLRLAEGARQLAVTRLSWDVIARQVLEAA